MEVAYEISKAGVFSNCHIVQSNDPHLNASALAGTAKTLPSPTTSNTMISRFRATVQTPSTITTL
ncbi:hypothetical protein [Gluconobacter frateurii]